MRASVAAPAIGGIALLLIGAAFALWRRGAETVSAPRPRDAGIAPDSPIGAREPAADVRVELARPVQERLPDDELSARDPQARARALARQIVEAEHAHRDRRARLARFSWIYEHLGLGDRIGEVARLHELETRTYEAAMAGFERELGARLFGEIRAALDEGAGTAPAMPEPEPPPEPEPAGKGG